MVVLTRRLWLEAVVAGGLGASSLQAQTDKDWVCPMDPDYRAATPGVCPRCGMKLVVSIPERIEYPLEVTHVPAVLRPGDQATLTLRVFNPLTQARVRSFEIVHEKLIHLFIVSENLEFFAHVHPEAQDDGSFRYQLTLPNPGMYRLLADFYPAGSTPQLALSTIFVAGTSEPVQLPVSLSPKTGKNLSVSLRLDPEQPIAGLETKLFFSLEPSDGLEPYLGAWAHMLSASSDLIDLLHLHPAFPKQGGMVQFNVFFPRPQTYRIWTQFQRKGVVNTVVFTVPVRAL